MSFSHGKGTVFKLDDLSGALQDISAYLRSAGGLLGRTERAVTTTFGAAAQRREVMGFREGGPIALAGPFIPASAKIHGKNVRFCIDEYAPYGYFRSGSIVRRIDLPNTETFGDSWREREVVGLMDGSFSLDGLFESAAGASDAVLRDLKAQETPAVLSLGLNGFVIGQLVEMVQVGLTEYRIGNELEGVVPVSSSWETDDRIDLGIALHDLSAETAAGDYASVDESAATSSGGVGHLHVTAFTGTTATVKIQDSVNDSVWTDLIEFTAVTGVTHERKEVSGNVDRYVRAQISSATITSMTFMVCFARRDYVYGTAGTHRHLCGLYGKAASSSFEFGPEGGAGSARKLSGECRLSSYTLNFAHDAVLDFAAELVVTGAVTEGTF